MSSKVGRRFCRLHPVSVLSLVMTIWLTAVICQAQTASGTPSDISRNQNDSIVGSWRFGIFAAGGFPPAYEIHTRVHHYGVRLDFINAGFELGKVVTARKGRGLLQGRGEAVVEMMPFWL